MKINVLDHGYVELVEAWGTGIAGDNMGTGDDYEVGIIEAARMSTQGSFRGWEQDAKLLAFLYNHRHLTPFEMAGMTIEVQAPIMVFREWHRHRTQSYNEMSARYTPLPELYYMPTVERLMINAGQSNKQAGTVPGAGDLSLFQAGQFQADLARAYSKFEDDYKIHLAMGVPKELARCGMPVGHYSRMRASANLRNWIAFLTLRLDPAAQWEIRQFASAVYTLVIDNFPRTAALFRPDDHRRT